MSLFIGCQYQKWGKSIIEHLQDNHYWKGDDEGAIWIGEPWTQNCYLTHSYRTLLLVEPLFCICYDKASAQIRAGEVFIQQEKNSFEWIILLSPPSKCSKMQREKNGGRRTRHLLIWCTLYFIAEKKTCWGQTSNFTHSLTRTLLFVGTLFSICLDKASAHLMFFVLHWKENLLK